VSFLDSFGEHAVHCKELPGFKYRHDLVRDVLYDVLKRAGISSRKEAPVNFLTDPLEGRSTLRQHEILCYGWAGGKHAFVDSYGESPLDWAQGLWYCLPYNLRLKRNRAKLLNTRSLF
ncbi:hypothetical protein Tco_1209088, partial [Tanacetum coccineum]